MGKTKSFKHRNFGGQAHRNFGGQAQELWYEGGEKAFVKRLIQESKQFAHHCLWFTTLVSQKSNLAIYDNLLERAKASEMKVIEMTQGQKTSRILAWRFAKI